MPKMKGPAIFLAQFMRDEEPYNSMENIGKWVAGLGYKGIQIPAWDERVINLDQAAVSKTYCDDFKGKLQEMGLEPTELAGSLAGQVLAVHPAYEIMVEAFHPPGLILMTVSHFPPSGLDLDDRCTLFSPNQSIHIKIAIRDRPPLAAIL